MRVPLNLFWNRNITQNLSENQQCNLQLQKAMRAAQVSCDNMLVFQGYGIICKIVAHFEGALLDFCRKDQRTLTLYFIFMKKKDIFS